MRQVHMRVLGGGMGRGSELGRGLFLLPLSTKPCSVQMPLRYLSGPGHVPPEHLKLNLATDQRVLRVEHVPAARCTSPALACLCHSASVRACVPQYPGSAWSRVPVFSDWILRRASNSSVSSLHTCGPTVPETRHKPYSTTMRCVTRVYLSRQCCNIHTASLLQSWGSRVCNKGARVSGPRTGGRGWVVWVT
jgi:hypothetical protein